MYGEIRVAWFQSYQFRQINPDCSGFQATFMTNVVSIVSIQADQSRQVTVVKLLMFLNRFNRINSCRSIPTKEILISFINCRTKFQSYQFMQINPDKEETIDYLTSKDLKFQSYQFMQINPDKHSVGSSCL